MIGQEEDTSYLYLWVHISLLIIVTTEIEESEKPGIFDELSDSVIVRSEEQNEVSEDGIDAIVDDIDDALTNCVIIDDVTGIFSEQQHKSYWALFYQNSFDVAKNNIWGERKRVLFFTYQDQIRDELQIYSMKKRVR